VDRHHRQTPNDCTDRREACTARFIEYRRTRDPQLRDQLILDHRWIAARSAQRFVGRGERFDDLEQVALVGLIKAVERLDPERDVAFSGYATPTIIGEIKRHFRDATWRVSVPRRPKELRTQVFAAVDTLHQRLGRSPNPDEISAHLGVERRDVLETIVANRVYRALSLDASSSESGDAVEGQYLARADSDDLASTVEHRVAALAAIGSLDARDRQIVYWRFFEECTQREIGDRLGIGQVQVSRLLRSALTQLRCHLSGVGFMGADAMVFDQPGAAA
jgi:RNA polymerase sigma-B factor